MVSSMSPWGCIDAWETCLSSGMSPLMSRLAKLRLRAVMVTVCVAGSQKGETSSRRDLSQYTTSVIKVFAVLLPSSITPV